jgi:hypothetical protein
VTSLQTNLEKINSQKFLLLSLLITAIIMLYVNFLNGETRTLVANLVYIPVPGIMLVLSIIIASKFRASGKHGKAWILFALFAGSWFTAEQIWMIYDVVYKIDPWPSIADFFYLVGYPLLTAFTNSYFIHCIHV